jgi:phospholipase C
MAPKIKHLVVLMLENRSFDHAIGYLQSDTYKINGALNAKPCPDADGTPIQVSGEATFIMADPPHEFSDVNLQLFGTRTPRPGSGPTMQGFVQSASRNVMKCFSPDRLPVLATLAQQYAVCDQWHSSIPGPTSPNRAFAHAASSNKSVDSDLDWLGVNSIYPAMDNANVSYRIYMHDTSLLMTNQYFINHQAPFQDFADFQTDCGGDPDAFPKYVFIEPRYAQDNNLFPNDQHPSHDVREGEKLIKKVYTTLRESNLWESTLLLIVYDEHGGFYDHQTPPSVAATPSEAGPTFAFDRLGVRVPAVLVSAFVAPHTIDSTLYEHSSIPATIRALFMPGTAPLTSREANARTFHTQLHWLPEARTDQIAFPMNNSLVVDLQPAAMPDNTPSDLVIAMGRQLQKTLDHLGLQSPLRGDQLGTQAEAATFFRSARALLGAGRVR